MRQAAFDRTREEELGEALRQRLLEATEWIEAVPDVTSDHSAWLDYRRRLKDLPQDPRWPHEISWPKPPRPDDHER